jgi:hypothetical protein
MNCGANQLEMSRELNAKLSSGVFTIDIFIFHHQEVGRGNPEKFGRANTVGSL